MKIRNIAAAAALAAGLVVTALAGSASASSFNCQPGAGCATLHSADDNGKAIAVDAKRQSANPGTLVIGYPDLVQDKATSFDKVLHFYKGGTVPFYTFVYAPNGDWSNQCLTANATTGMLSLSPCTLGLDAYQRFTAHVYTAPVQTVVANADANPPVVGVTGSSYKIGDATFIGDYSTQTYMLLNDGTVGYLESTSTAVPTVPQPDATDTRQLDANGPLPASAANATTGVFPGAPASELWTWNS